MKIIFLDFDGVISVADTHYSLSGKKMELVKRICDETGAKIIISSSWRHIDVPNTLRSIEESKAHRKNDPFILADYVIDITPRFYFKYGDESVYIPRGVEIQHTIYKYMYRYKDLGVDKITNYLILDDDSDMLLWHKDHFIKTDPYEGIVESDVEKAIEILNNEKLYIV